MRLIASLFGIKFTLEPGVPGKLDLILKGKLFSVWVAPLYFIDFINFLMAKLNYINLAVSSVKMVTKIKQKLGLDAWLVSSDMPSSQWLFIKDESSKANVRMAEWSKAPDSSSGPRERAWVQIPLLTKFLIFIALLFKIVIFILLLIFKSSTNTANINSMSTELSLPFFNHRSNIIY